jgi:diguanylate cyclase (GGDEF)-like protein
MLRLLDAVLGGRPHWLIASIGAVIVFLIGMIELRTGHEISFFIFYLVPIGIVSWFGGRAMGMIFAFLTAGISLSLDIASGHVFTNAAIPVWNAVMRLGILVVVISFLSENRRLLESEHKLARTDPLTRVANSRYLLEILEREIKRSSRSSKPISLVYMDVDNFKQVNDLQGHGAGNRLLLVVADTIAHHIRDIDTVGRLGGDEFAIVLPETGEEDARGVIGRVQERLRTAMAMGQWPVTFSFGVLTCYHAACDVEELVRRADALMYRSKATGKDRITYDVTGYKEGPHR